jgi:hypothetical protein
MTITAMEIRDMLGKCFASGFVLLTAAMRPEDYSGNIYHDLRNIGLLQKTLFAISASLAAWQTAPPIEPGLPTTKSRREFSSLLNCQRARQERFIAFP